MPRWVWFLPLGVVVSAGALQAFRLGWIAANMTETAAIEAYAARYVQQTGAPAAHCSARPGEKVWLIVRCGLGDTAREYHVNRFGGLQKAYGPGAASDSLSFNREHET